MKKREKRVAYILRAGMTVLTIILIILFFGIMSLVSDLQGTARVVNYAGLVRGETQRVIKLEMSKEPDDEMIATVEAIINGLRFGSDELDLVRLKDTEFQGKMDELAAYFTELKEEISKVRQKGYEQTAIIGMSEKFFRMCDEVTGIAERYSQKRATALNHLEKIVVADIVCLVLLIGVELLRALRFAAQNRILRKKIYLDESTGLPNKNKCEEILSDPTPLGEEESTAICVFDLNNLRVTVFRLRKMLIEAGLPEYEYIVKEKGVFYWRSPMKVDLDVARFMELVREGEEEVDETRKMNLWEKACRLYKGELLPMQSGEDWVIMNSVRYKDKYSKILRRLCAYRKEQHEYDTILELTDNAIEIYPFDEWQSLKIDALMGMNRYKEAYQLYDATSKMFFEELGITPSERMMNQFQEMSERMGRKYHAAGEIKEDLKEPEYEDGAFYCSLPSFRDNYRLVRRLIERNGQSAFLMVCSLYNRIAC